MITKPVTLAQLRQDVAQVAGRYGISVEGFLRSDIDDLPSDELRDLWLMVKGVLVP